MPKSNLKKVLVILGPTAVGKTEVAIKLAKKFDSELIAADSRQVYKDLDLGTGKYSPSDHFKKFSGKWLLNDVWIHGYDLVEPEKRFTAADFAKFFAKTVKTIWSQNKLPILTGGTGFYIKAALVGFETLGISPNYQLRKKLEKFGPIELYSQLLAIDRKKAESLSYSDKKNPRRLVRAIEVAKLQESHPNSISMYRYMKKGEIDILKIGLTCEREKLFRRIDERVEDRIKMGMIDEVRNLLNKKINPNWLDSLGLEYRWIASYLLGKVNFASTLQRLKSDIRNFARRQLTWFKKDKDIMWFDITDKNYDKKVEKTVQKWYDNKIKN